MTEPSSPASQSIRYQRLLEVMDKVMTFSKSQFDVDKAVKECYGDDASIFAQSDSNNGSSGSDNMLQAVLDDLLSSAQDQVAEEMRKQLKELNVEDKLLKLEKIIQQLEQEEIQQRQAEDDDKQSARQALEQVRLPKGLSPTDIVNYQAFQTMKKEKDAMLEEIATVEREIEQLNAKKEERSRQMEERMSVMKTAGRELEKSADFCSMVA
jgi:preprotein translocase subunit SecD